MSRSRLPLYLGLGAASGVGYYLYAAGGSPRAAENKFESDVHKASANVKSHLPNTERTNVEGNLKGYGKEAGAKVDSAIAEADRQAGVAKSKAEAYAKDAKAESLRVIDKFDSKVEDGAAKAKSGISSWFGGSK
ncbi:hypothetical protein G7046_g7450 [Stylonectria norvegica]|nr:hypothetical protein G7046_g7450 [Stylonectria norvegica]